MTDSKLKEKAAQMRHAIDMMEGAMMGSGELIDIPDKFEGANDDLILRPKITLGQLRRIVRELSELTRIINSSEFNIEEVEEVSKAAEIDQGSMYELVHEAEEEERRRVFGPFPWESGESDDK